MKLTKKFVAIVSIALALLLLSSAFMVFSNPTSSNVDTSSAPTSVNAGADYGDLLQYEWPATMGDPENTHFSAGPGPNAADILWQAPISSSMTGPVAFNGLVFVPQGPFVVAFDPFTGSIKYNVTLPSIPFATAGSIFKLDNTRMVVVQIGGLFVPGVERAWRFLCLNTTSGALLWSSETREGDIPWNNDQGSIYSSEEKMYYAGCADLTGKGGTQSSKNIEAWNFSDPLYPPTLEWISVMDTNWITLCYGDGKLFVGGGAPHQTCVDAKTGQVLWETEVTGEPEYCACYYQGKLLRGHLDNTFYAINGSTGTVLWTFHPGTYGFWASGCAAAYGMVYELNVDGHLYALDVNDGHVVWKYKGPGQYYPGYIDIADGKVYACTGQALASPISGVGKSEYACLDAFTGELIWKVDKEFGAGPLAFTCIAYGNFYGIDFGGPLFLSLFDPFSKPILYCFGPPKDWSMFRGDPAHTGIGQSGPTNLALRWKFTTKGAVQSSPAIVDGKVYVGSHDKNVYCLDARSGALIWNFTTGYRIRSSPAVVDGRVYTGADDGYIYCLEANTGKQIWNASAPGYVVLQPASGCVVEYRSSPTVVWGKVYVGSLDGNVYCLNASTGEIIWTYPTTGAVLSTPTAIAYDGLYISSRNGTLYKLDVTDGTLIWKLDTPIGKGIDMTSTPTVADGMVFIGSGASSDAPSGMGAFYGINATNGDLVWTNDFPQAGNAYPIWSALYLDGKLYYADGFWIDYVHAKNGTLIWQSYLTREHYSSPSFADGKIYVGSDSFSLYVINATSGEKLSWYQTNGQIWSSPALYEGKVYCGSIDWNVYCFEEAEPSW